MAQIFKKCSKCGEILTILTDSKVTFCKSCDSEFETSSLLDTNDKTFINQLSSEDIENSLKYNALIMQGNENLANMRYKKAEECYKMALDVCENRYEGYYGVVRAKTHDFQIVPNSKDYLEYANLAYEYANNDIDQKISANLAKLGVIKKK